MKERKKKGKYIIASFVLCLSFSRLALYLCCRTLCLGGRQRKTIKIIIVMKKEKETELPSAASPVMSFRLRTKNEL